MRKPFDCFMDQETFDDSCRGFLFDGSLRRSKIRLGGEMVIKPGVLPRIHPPKWGNERGGKENRWHGLGQGLMHSTVLYHTCPGYVLC